MRAIVRWEQLLRKPFVKMDYANEYDVEALMYCVALSSNKITCTLTEFVSTLANKKLATEMAKSLARESAVMGQFSAKESDDQGHEGDGGFIKDLVFTLVMAGVDAEFVMEQLPLCDLPLLIDAYQNKKKEQMESDRLWTYLNILPHVDGKKLPSARELYPFPWEEAEMEKAAAESIQEDSDKLEEFFKQGKNYINQNYGK